METPLLSPERSKSDSLAFPFEAEATEQVIASLDWQAVELADHTTDESDIIDIPVLVHPDSLTESDRRLIIESEFRAKANIQLGLAWWNSDLMYDIHDYRIDTEESRRSPRYAEPLAVGRAHEFTAGDDKAQDGFYQVVEIGQQAEGRLTDSELDAIEATLVQVDQFTGGAIGRDENMRRILAYSDDNLLTNGFANSDGVVLNVTAIRRTALEEGVDPEVLLSVTLAHEVLGHQSDRLAGGGSLQEFAKHFSYEGHEQHTGANGVVYDSHELVVPLTDGAISSGPVRAYGGASDREDLATSAESIATRTLGLDSQMQRSNRFRTTPDNHRDQLMLDLFDKVAKSVQHDAEQSTGYVGVGSPIVRRDTSEGPVYVSGRELKRQTINRQDFINQEISIVAQKLSNKLIGKKVRFVSAGIDDFN